MGKLLSWVVLGLFLVVVPFISWYYLKAGLDYRKEALSELSVKDSINVSMDTLQRLVGKTTLLVNDNSKKTTELLSPILEQFKNSQGFQIVTFDTIQGFSSLPENYIPAIRAKYADKSFILIDTSLQVRNVYTRDIQEIRKMIEHIAIVIPRVKESDIKMKQ